MRTTYRFSTLRYVYDPLTQEFVNVGVIVYSPESRKLMAKCTVRYSRISKLFGTFDGVRVRQSLKFTQDSINRLGKQISEGLPFDEHTSLEKLISRIIPADDSAIQLQVGGAGLSADLDVTLQNLFFNYVDRYDQSVAESRREDEDVWNTFKGPLERAHVAALLAPKVIIARDYQYNFERSWKNGKWNVYEPLSFDLQSTDAILDKANRWVGRATSLNDGAEPFKLHLLLGAPTDSSLREAYVRAENILNKMPVDHDFVSEADAESFATNLASELKAQLHH